MKQIHSVLGKDPKACVCRARAFDDEMDEFGHTHVHFAFNLIRRGSKKWTNFVQFFEPIHTQIARGRDAFDPLLSANFLSKIGTSRKCSKLQAVPCAFLLVGFAVSKLHCRGQNRHRLDKVLFKNYDLMVTNQLMLNT